MPLSNTFAVPENINVQHPLSTDGDSVYVKDILLEASTSTNFTGGDVTDLLNNLHSSIVNTTTENPKTILIHFNRTVVSNTLGVGAYEGDFSNVKVEMLTSGHIATTPIDESSSNIKYTSRTFQLPVTAGINALRITFHTADTVSLSNLVMLKTISVVSRGQAVKPDGTVIDLNATVGGNQKFSMEEYDGTFRTNPLPVISSKKYITNIDEATSTITYVGKAIPGTATSASLWQISRMDTSGISLVELFAEGTLNFDKVWDDRILFDYS